MKRYPSYKDSEIEWIGQIPKDWDIAPIRALCYLGRGRVISNEEIANNSGDYPVYSSQTAENGIMGCLNTYDFDGEYVTWTTDGANAGTVFHRQGKFNCTNVCGTLKAKAGKVFPKYLPYVLNLGTKCYVRYDINPKLMNNEMAGIRIPLPKVEEQKDISRYLDLKTAQIDDLIAKKERMIELLKEERTAIINQAVTKGLDPKVEIKDSGIEWLGKIPKHWGLKRLKYLVKLINEKGAINDNSIRVDLENIESWTGQLIKGDSTVATDEEMKQFIPGDVLFNKLRPYLAKVFHARQEGICGGELLVLRPSVQIDSAFLYYRAISNDFIRVIDGSTYGTKMPRASWDFIGNLFIPYPSIEEQRRIVDFFDRKTAQIDAQVAREQRLIDLLKEYRTSLISEIVTGKICVLNQDCGANNAA